MDGNHAEAGVTGPVLHLFCGKIAAGKSTLAARLAAAPGRILIGEDRWNATLWPTEMRTIEDYARFSARLRAVMAPLVVDVLRQGVSVVLDFQANTPAVRRWMRGLIEQAGAQHVLHVLEADDALCLRRLAGRNASGVHDYQVSEATFAQVTAYFVPPGDDEGFNIQRHPQC